MPSALDCQSLTSQTKWTYLPAYQLWNKNNFSPHHQESQGVIYPGLLSTLAFLVLHGVTHCKKKGKACEVVTNPIFLFWCKRLSQCHLFQAAAKIRVDCCKLTVGTKDPSKSNVPAVLTGRSRHCPVWCTVIMIKLVLSNKLHAITLKNRHWYT